MRENIWGCTQVYSCDQVSLEIAAQFHQTFKWEPTCYNKRQRRGVWLLPRSIWKLSFQSRLFANIALKGGRGWGTLIKSPLLIWYDIQITCVLINAIGLWDNFHGSFLWPFPIQERVKELFLFRFSVPTAAHWHRHTVHSPSAQRELFSLNIAFFMQPCIWVISLALYSPIGFYPTRGLIAIVLDCGAYPPSLPSSLAPSFYPHLLHLSWTMPQLPGVWVAK